MNGKLRFPLMIGVAALAAMSMGQVRISSDGRPERLYMPRVGLSLQDSQFMKDAAAANMFEIESSKIALMQGRSVWTRQFAKEMIADHTAAQNELKQIAMDKGITLPSSLPMKLQAKINQLRGLHGSAFDRAYKMAQQQGHSETKMKMAMQVKRGHDEDARDYAVKTLPAVTMHLKMIKMGVTMTGPTKMQDNM